ncbi:hypothetical protein CAPTEDRAFT_184712 [Capitella teleta]|uniref:Cytochrome P450 n=1 Tax=Capitella teleta TaxID=283909 RepID=R7VM33_CAPTE|nr:hypothetical protein CAPTEDRAFT_184712 [Capitella teleta]|eukprot:ELU18791.1 hypothetical protein CAPTEDRAFT_184712 [Capitella teleta]
MAVIISIGLVLLSLCLVAWLLGWHRPSLSHLPHKKGLPIIGNFHQINLRRPELTFTHWGKELGSVFSVKILNNTFVVLNSFDAIREALITKGSDFAGRPHVNSYRLEFATMGFRDISLLNPGVCWKLLRKISLSQIKMFDTGMKRIEELSSSMNKDMVNMFRSLEGRSFNPKVSIYNTVMNVLTMLLMNRKFEKTDKEFKLITEMERLLMSSIAPSGEGVELDILPWLRYFGNSTFKKLKLQAQHRDELWSMIKPRILEDIRSDDKGSDGLMHVLFRLYHSQQEGTITNTYLLEEVDLIMTFVDVIIAGTGTTFNSFCGFLNILSQHEDIQEKLQEEVDRVIGSNRTVSLNDRANMPYTQATVLELLRSISVAALGLPHATLKKTSISGIPIPAGVQILMNLWGLHHDEGFWGDPHSFRPERFLDEAGDVVSASHENRRHLMPFGAGTRVCIGERLAMGRLFMMIATMAQVFIVEQGHLKSSWDPRTYQSGIVLHPLDYEIQLKSRNDHLYTE